MVDQQADRRTLPDLWKEEAAEEGQVCEEGTLPGLRQEIQEGQEGRLKRQSNRLLARFRVYPDKKTLFFMVYVWPTKKAMHYHVGMASEIKKDFLAIVCSNETIKFPKHGPRRKRPLLGQIHFYEDSLRMGIICHEAGHAALAWAERMGIDCKEKSQDQRNASHGEEQFCWALGNIARQIVIRTKDL